MSRLLTWLHLSDIHFGDGTRKHRLDKSLVLDRLVSDVQFVRANEGLAPDLLFLTGDISFSGGSRSSDEYERAGDLVQRLLSILDLTEEQVFTVPGNHDANLSNDESDERLRMLLNALRNGDEDLDELGDASWDALEVRFEAYEAFARKYGNSREALSRGGHWYVPVSALTLGDVSVALVGINTALTTKLRDNEGHLRMGLAPLVALEGKPRSDISILLTHHPTDRTWVRDFGSLTTRLGQSVDIHLSGHVHAAATESLRRGDGAGVVNIVSGAAHNEEGEIGHGYSFGAIDTNNEQLVVRVWPRLWYDGKQDFDRHADILPKSSAFAEHPLSERVQGSVSSARIKRRSPPEVGVSGMTDQVDELVRLIPVAGVGLFRDFAESTVRDALGQLKRLALLRQTPELWAGGYYQFLIPLIDQAAPGSEIWAISTMMSVEWTDDSYEREFLRANIAAAERGVSLERIFVVPDAQVAELGRNPAIRAQMAHGGISTLLVKRESLERTDRNLLSKLGAGVIAFGDELVLVDRHSENGEARGYGTMLREDVSRWRQIYRELRWHARPVSLEEGKGDGSLVS